MGLARCTSCTSLPHPIPNLILTDINVSVFKYKTAYALAFLPEQERIERQVVKAEGRFRNRK